MIKLPTDTEELARRVAVKTGKSPEEVIREALEERARGIGVPASAPAPEPKEQRTKPDLERMRAIAHRAASRPLLDTRTDDEILGYDEFGIPR